VKKTFIYSTILSAALLTACATPQPTWKKSGVTLDDTQTALAECRYQVKLNKIADSEQEHVIADCMESKGFRWRRR
tara:strand:+ start:1214 stop:1441 length:228 start_codon:yes stop_codon:yes gene_type:complete